VARKSAEIKRFDEAIEMLLNSRWLHQQVTAAIFAYADGKITLEQLEEEM
jgi:hypothetical protein